MLWRHRVATVPATLHHPKRINQVKPGYKPTFGTVWKRRNVYECGAEYLGSLISELTMIYLYVRKTYCKFPASIRIKECQKEDSGCRTNLFEGMFNPQLWYFCYISNAQQLSSSQTTCRGQTLGTLIACSPDGVSKLQKLFLLIISRGLTGGEERKKSPKLQEIQPISTKFQLQTNIPVWSHPDQRAHSGSARPRIRPVENHSRRRTHVRTHDRNFIREFFWGGLYKHNMCSHKRKDPETKI